MVIAKRHGQLNTLADICQQSMENLIGLSQKNRSLAGITQIMQGSLFYERNNLPQADRILSQGLKFIKKDGMIELLVKGWFALACTRIAQGKDHALPDLVKIAEQGNQALKFYTASLQARLHLLLARNSFESKHFYKANRWADAQTLYLRKQSSYDWEIYEKLVYARVCCLQFRSIANVQNKARLVEIFEFFNGSKGIPDRTGLAGDPDRTG